MVDSRWKGEEEKRGRGEEKKRVTLSVAKGPELEDSYACLAQAAQESLPCRPQITQMSQMSQIGVPDGPFLCSQFLAHAGLLLGSAAVAAGEGQGEQDNGGMAEWRNASRR
jgi:hypothetical protein